MDDFLRTLEDVVNHESPSVSKAQVNQLGAYLARRLTRLGAQVEHVPADGYGDHLVASYGRGEGRPVLVLCHMDTVFEVGSAGRFRIEDGRARGPGVLDMKGGIVQLLYALEACRDLNLEPAPLRIIINSDEELGSPSSRPLIERYARQSRHVLVLEPGIGPEGRLKTARKGVGMFRIRVTGRAAHAGSDPAAGASAVVELARQILALHALNCPETGTSVNVAPIQGGERRNVVAASAQGEIDVRVATRAEAERMEAALRALGPVTPGTAVTVEGGMNRPPMECSPEMATLAARAQAFAAELGWVLETGATGGASDGNFTAALGVPTLDGLGAAGAGAHSLSEYAVVGAFAPRTALLVRLLCEL
jgi:glutamate carboxypeptidase